MPHLLFHLDANAVNARQSDSYLNELDRLAAIGAIELEYSDVAYDEAEHGNGIRKTKAGRLTWAGLSHQPELEDSWRTLIAEATFPNGTITASQRNDVESLLTAKIASAILVTTDGASKSQPRGILGRKRALDALGIKVVTHAESVALTITALNAISKLNID